MTSKEEIRKAIAAMIETVEIKKLPEGKAKGVRPYGLTKRLSQKKPKLDEEGKEIPRKKRKRRKTPSIFRLPKIKKSEPAGDNKAGLEDLARREAEFEKLKSERKAEHKKAIRELRKSYNPRKTR